MRIQRENPSAEAVWRFGKDVGRAAQARGVEGRICGAHCVLVCPQCGSKACQCRCAPECPDAPAALSSDPETHPVEAAILPLVFEMRRLGLFCPCWSCEGHLDPAGQLWKLPAVWFYCDSLVHVRLLAAGLTRLSAAGGLKAKWQVVVTFSDPDNVETAFSLEPREPLPSGVGLGELRADIGMIARSLQAMMNGEARGLKCTTPVKP